MIRDIRIGSSVVVGHSGTLWGGRSTLLLTSNERPEYRSRNIQHLYHQPVGDTSVLVAEPESRNRSTYVGTATMEPMATILPMFNASVSHQQGQSNALGQVVNHQRNQIRLKIGDLLDDLVLKHPLPYTVSSSHPTRSKFSYRNCSCLIG